MTRRDSWSKRHPHDFNPHEREARDQRIANRIDEVNDILIHTSVKLVTGHSNASPQYGIILIHTSVKLVTMKSDSLFGNRIILIHTSVKLVTNRHLRHASR